MAPATTLAFLCFLAFVHAQKIPSSIELNEVRPDFDRYDVVPAQLAPVATGVQEDHPKVAIGSQEDHPEVVHGEEGHDWGYGLQDNPLTWPGRCNAGHRQSPVDINPDNYEIAHMSRLFFVFYEKSGNLSFTNNGHTIIVEGFENWKEQPYIFGGDLGSRYRLIQFHLHWAQTDIDGSEHTVDHIHYPVEVHFVHLKENYSWEEASHHDDGISVVGVFAADTPVSRPFASLSNYFNSIRHIGDTVSLTNFNMYSLLPHDRSTFYRYSGSLTTPPCDESVIWTVLADPISISPRQLALLRQIAGHDGEPQDHNDRPVQEFYERHVLFRPSDFDSASPGISCAVPIIVILIAKFIF